MFSKISPDNPFDYHLIQGLPESLLGLEMSAHKSNIWVIHSVSTNGKKMYAPKFT